MTITFVKDVQFVCLSALAVLLFYTLWLSRYRGLDAHVTVRWVLVQCAAILAVALWRWLPIFEFTSRLQDRQLLLVTTVLFFAFVTFLMLDLLVRISRQSVQIKKLAQELAIQRQRIDGIAPSEASQVRNEADVAPASQSSLASRLRSSLLGLLFLSWVLCVVALNGVLLNEPLSMWIVGTIAPLESIDATLKPLFTAAYLN